MSDFNYSVEFRRLVCRFSQQLNDEEREAIVYVRLYPLRHKYKSATNLEVLSRLETDGLFSMTKPEGLIEIAKDVNRQDLVSEVKDFLTKKKAGFKSEKKVRKRTTDEPELSDEELHLKATFEVTLAQVTVLMQQVDILQSAIAGGKEQRERAAEAICEAGQTTDALSQRLRRAQQELGLCSPEGGSSPEGGLSPTSEETTPKPHHSSTTSPKPTAQIQARGKRPKTPLLPPSRKPEQPPPDTDSDYEDVLTGDCVTPVEESMGHYYASRDLTANRPDLQHHPNLKMPTSNRLTHSAPSTPVPTPRHSATSLTPLKGSRIPVFTSFPVPNERKYTQSKQVSGSQTSDYSGSDYTGSTGSTGSGTADSGFSSASSHVREWTKHKLTSYHDSEIRPTSQTRKPQQQLYTHLSNSGMNDSQAQYQPVPKARSPRPHHS